MTDSVSSIPEYGSLAVVKEFDQKMAAISGIERHLCFSRNYAGETQFGETGGEFMMLI
jgi:hypothetical protein